MTNLWLKKNPVMSLWLSGANHVLNQTRGQALAAVKRQSTINARRVGQAWTDAWRVAMHPKRRR